MSNETTPATTEATPLAINPDASMPVDFLSTLPEDLRSDPVLQNFKGKEVTDVVKSYISAQKELGSRIRIPGPEASAEARAEFMKKLEAVPGVTRLPDAKDPASIKAFFTKLGCPETAEGYKLELPENFVVDPVAMSEFKQVAHRLGLNSPQVNELIKMQANASALAAQRITEQAIAAKTTLSEVWGNELDNRLNTARAVIDKFGEKYPEAVAQIRDNANPMGSNPVFLMMAAELGKMYKEQGLVKGDVGLKGGFTPEEAQARITELKANKASPYYNPRDPKHKEVFAEVSQLYDAAYPSKKSA